MLRGLHLFIVFCMCPKDFWQALYLFICLLPAFCQPLLYSSAKTAFIRMCMKFLSPRQLIYNYPEQLFADNGVMAIEHADFEGVERLALVTGDSITVSGPYYMGDLNPFVNIRVDRSAQYCCQSSVKMKLRLYSKSLSKNIYFHILVNQNIFTKLKVAQNKCLR